jgi:hypothetical protein
MPNHISLRSILIPVSLYAFMAQHRGMKTTLCDSNFVLWQNGYWLLINGGWCWKSIRLWSAKEPDTSL